MMEGKCYNLSLATIVAYIITCLITVVSSTELIIQQQQDEEESTVSSDRDLQTNVIINAACNFVSRILPGDILCECALTLGFLFVCAFQSPICLGPDQTGYCSVPTLQGDVRLVRRTIAFEFCLEDATRNGIPTSGLCFDIGGVLDEEDANTFDVQQQEEAKKSTSSKFTSTLSSIVSKVVPSKKSSTTTSKIIDCTGSSEDGTQTCNSCQICNIEGSSTTTVGYIFDCSNIDELLIQTTCTPLSIITNLRNSNQDISFLPHFDFEG